MCVGERSVCGRCATVLIVVGHPATVSGHVASVNGRAVSVNGQAASVNGQAATVVSGRAATVASGRAATVNVQAVVVLSVAVRPATIGTVAENGFVVVLLPCMILSPLTYLLVIHLEQNHLLVQCSVSLNI